MHRPPPTIDNPPFVEIMRKIGLEPDPWQVEVFQPKHPQILLNCCRQAGKSTVVAILGLLEAMCKPMTRVVLVSRSHRQSREMLKQMTFYYDLLRRPVEKRVNAQEIEMDNLSRIVSVPCREDTIRGYAHVDLLIIDEAARVPDDLYRAVRPMLAVSKGRLLCLSTPYGKRGFFWNAWANGGDDWQRIEVPASMCPRITPEFLEQEKRAMGESWFRQEYCCSFEALEGLVYPDFGRCVASSLACAAGSEATVGGIDFGFRNPFAALWGFVDRDGALWLTGEHYARQKPLSHHAERLPRNVMWYVDPAGANESAELRCAGFMVRPGNNALRPGIAAVTARLQSGRLRVLAGRCPNLLAEAGLYRWGETATESRAESPVDEHNHALAALRYLISRLDARHMAGERRPDTSPAPVRPRTPDWDDERYWMPLN
jgi:hypothetical protein